MIGSIRRCLRRRRARGLDAPPFDPPMVSRTRGLACVSLDLVGGNRAKDRTNQPRIVVALDAGEQLAASLVPGRQSSQVSEFDDEGMGAASPRGVIVAGAGPA